MPRAADARILTARDREILKDVIASHIVTGDPVSSRTVAKHGRHSLSAASIRNVMADLEEMGLLRQPHTSSGRVPTASGYHLYIEDLMGAQPLPEAERRYIDAQLPSGVGPPESQVQVASQLLSALSRRVGIVLIPALGESVLKAVDFVPLSGCKVLCVVVSAGGFVDTKLVETEQPVPREALQRAANYLTENFAGKTLRDTRERLLVLMDRERAQMDRLLGLAVTLARQGLEGSDAPQLRVDGTTRLLNEPELADVERVRRLLETFNDRVRLVRLLNQCMSGRGVRVLINEESELTSELDFSLVATSYRLASGTEGTLGIFGPSRTAYDRVIPLVEYLASRLSRVLATTFDQ